MAGPGIVYQAWLFMMASGAPSSYFFNCIEYSC